MAQWVKVPLVTIVTADCNKKVRNNGQCLSEAEKRKTKLQTHSVINSAPCERSFHERAAAGGHIEDRLNGPVIQKSLDECNWLWLVPKKWHILAMALLPLCRRGRWTLDCWLKQNVLLPFEAQKNFRNRPGTHARVCALERGFFAAGSEVFLFARVILARWTGHLTAMVSTLNTAKGTRRERPPRGGQPPAKTMWPSAEWGWLRTPSSCRIVAAVRLLIYWTSTMSHEI